MTSILFTSGAMIHRIAILRRVCGMSIVDARKAVDGGRPIPVSGSALKLHEAAKAFSVTFAFIRDADLTTQQVLSAARAAIANAKLLLTGKAQPEYGDADRGEVLQELQAVSDAIGALGVNDPIAAVDELARLVDAAS